MGALNNENLANQNSISETTVKNCIRQVLYQNAADKPISKPHVVHYKFERLSFHKLKAVYKPAIRPSLLPLFKTIEGVDGLDVNKNSSASKIFEKM